MTDIQSRQLLVINGKYTVPTIGTMKSIKYKGEHIIMGVNRTYTDYTYTINNCTPLSLYCKNATDSDLINIVIEILYQLINLPDEYAYTARFICSHHLFVDDNRKVSGLCYTCTKCMNRPPIIRDMAKWLDDKSINASRKIAMWKVCEFIMVLLIDRSWQVPWYANVSVAHLYNLNACDIFGTIWNRFIITGGYELKSTPTNDESYILWVPNASIRHMFNKMMQISQTNNVEYSEMLIDLCNCIESTNKIIIWTEDNHMRFLDKYRSVVILMHLIDIRLRLMCKDTLHWLLGYHLWQLVEK
jgi:hypothetical protein